MIFFLKKHRNFADQSFIDSVPTELNLDFVVDVVDVNYLVVLIEEVALVAFDVENVINYLKIEENVVAVVAVAVTVELLDNLNEKVDDVDYLLVSFLECVFLFYRSIVFALILLNTIEVNLLPIYFLHLLDNFKKIEN